MKIDPKLTEEQNLIKHINSSNDSDIRLEHVFFENPIAILDLPELVEKEDIKNSVFIEERNTKIKLAAKRNNKKFGRDTKFFKYRRIHLGVQWYIYNKKPNDGERYIVKSNYWLHDKPTLEEIFEVIKEGTEFRKESLVIEILELTDNKTYYDVAVIKVKPKEDSKIYIGSFIINVIFHTVSFLPIYINSFTGVEDVGKNKPIIPISLNNSFVI